MPIPWLGPDPSLFPPLEQALDEPDGLLAAGGDLAPERLLAAYQRGIFPWYEADQPILWWSPDPRTVFRPDQVHCSKRLRRQLRRGDFQFTMDSAFDRVMDGCAALTAERPGTWITADMHLAYRQLHQLGWAHSIEVWQDDQLVGGLYGVALGRVFFGESMFSNIDNASKAAMVILAAQLRDLSMVRYTATTLHAWEQIALAANNLAPF